LTSPSTARAATTDGPPTRRSREEFKEGVQAVFGLRCRLVAFSCKQRGFCPSCSAKRATLWAEFVWEQVIRPVPHRHLVFALPKVLRPAFRPSELRLPRVDRPPHFPHSRPGNASRPLLRRLLECPPGSRATARSLPGGPAGGQAARSPATRQCLAYGPPEIVGAADSPRVRGRPTAVYLRPENARRGLPQPGSRHPQDPCPHRAAL
jgi:hypothetical protein